jgi:hypothetical protein
LLAPSLAGPLWVRRLTTAIAAAIIGGGIFLINTEGVDFTLLRPLWLAVALFLAIPAAFGAAIGPLTEHWDKPEAWVNQGKARRWIVVGVVLAFVPFAIPMVAFAAAVMIAWAWVDRLPPVHDFRKSGASLSLARAACCAVVALSLNALIEKLVKIF